MSEPRIRVLGPDDADAFIALRRQGLDETPFAFASSLSDDFTGDSARVRQALEQAPTVVSFGAFVEGELVGTAGTGRRHRHKESHRGDVFGMYVHPEHRGRGIAAALLEAIIAHARDLGLRRLGLDVSTSAESARRLYERLGFVEWGYEPDALCHEGRYQDTRHMTLRL